MLTSAVTNILREEANTLKDRADLDPLIDKIKDKAVVMLGEATHGTGDFYQWRAEISKILIREHGFKFIAVEGDWPDAQRVSRYIRFDEGLSARKVLMQNHRWPTWLWANEETANFVEWLKNYETPFYGLDLYSFFESVEAAGNFLKQNYPEYKSLVKSLNECLSVYDSDGVNYARSLVHYPDGCHRGILNMFTELHKLRLQNHNDEEIFDAYQNALVAHGGEEYYRTMLHGDERSWNIRDRHMMKTLTHLLEKHEKGIVWAHNTHIGDYRATDMAKYGMVNLGGLAREQLGDTAVSLVGFGTYQGRVVASYSWDGKELILPLPPAIEGSYEYYFHKVAKEKKSNGLFVLMDKAKKDHPLNESGGHRAVGVVYDPQHQPERQFVKTKLASRYDAFIFIDRTAALHSFDTHFDRRLLPVTYPLGQ